MQDGFGVDPGLGVPNGDAVRDTSPARISVGALGLGRVRGGAQYSRRGLAATACAQSETPSSSWTRGRVPDDKARSNVKVRACAC